MDFVLVPIREISSTFLAVLCSVDSMEFLDMDFEVSFTATGGGAEFTLEYWFVTRMD